MKTNSKFNDINFKKLNAYNHLQVNSLWQTNSIKKDFNYINAQLFERFTQKNDRVLDLIIEENQFAMDTLDKLILNLDNTVQFIIIRLENCNIYDSESEKAFYKKLKSIIKKCHTLLDENRFLAIIVQDSYYNSEVKFVGFECANIISKQGFKLSSMVITNLSNGDLNEHKEKIWRYRALSGGYYINNHEYIFIFQKKYIHDYLCNNKDNKWQV